MLYKDLIGERLLDLLYHIYGRPNLGPFL